MGLLLFATTQRTSGRTRTTNIRLAHDIGPAVRCRSAAAKRARKSSPVGHDKPVLGCSSAVETRETGEMPGKECAAADTVPNECGDTAGGDRPSVTTRGLRQRSTGAAATGAFPARRLHRAVAKPHDAVVVTTATTATTTDCEQDGAPIVVFGIIVSLTQH